MVGKVRLVAAVVAVAAGAGGVPIAAPATELHLLQGTRALSAVDPGNGRQLDQRGDGEHPDAPARRAPWTCPRTRSRPTGSGHSSFDGLEPGSYVVEMMSPAQRRARGDADHQREFRPVGGRARQASVPERRRSAAPSASPCRRLLPSLPPPSPRACSRRASRALPQRTGRCRDSDREAGLSSTDPRPHAASRRPRRAVLRPRRPLRRTPTSICSTALRCSTATAASRSPSSC